MAPRLHGRRWSSPLSTVRSWFLTPSQAGAHTATTVPEVHFGGAVICGLMTATFGGMTRDVLCRKPARILFADKEVGSVLIVLFVIVPFIVVCQLVLL